MCLRECPWKTSGEFQIKSDTNMALGPQHATQDPGKGEHYLDVQVVYLDFEVLHLNV